jgi:probable HAF family extracellular repeat protein
MPSGIPIHVLAVLVLGFVLSFAGPLNAAAGPPPYEVVEIGTLAEQGVTYAHALNNSGVVVGGSMVRYSGGPVGYHAFRWSNSVIEDLNVAAGYSFASAINDAGQIVGAYRGDDPLTRVFLMDPEGNISRPDLFNHRIDTTLDINDLGQILFNQNFGSNSRALLYEERRES